jgi:hypothetical protein
MKIEMYCIINQDEELQGQNFLVRSNEIGKGLITGDDSVYFLPENKRKIAETILKKGCYDTMDETYGNIEEFAETLKSAIDGRDFIDLSDDSEVFLWHDCYGDWDIATAEEIDGENYYEYWDGSKHIITPIFNSVLVEFDGELETDLDETYIDSNYYFKEKFCHANSYKIISIDGEKPAEPMFLVEEYSQWQGNHKTGKIMTEIELKNYCEAENDNSY